MSKFRRVIYFVMTSTFVLSAHAESSLNCATLFSPQLGKAQSAGDVLGKGPSIGDVSSDNSKKAPPVRVVARSESEAWQQSVLALHQIDQKVYGRSEVIEALTTAMLAHEFVWINGEPGGAKTYLSRLMFQSALNAIPEGDKRVFVLQFHKLVSEGKITGFQKFSSMMKEGKYEIETSTSLVGDQFLYLIADEAEKSNPAVLNALLSVLNERKAFLGARVVDSILSSGVFTSNKTTGEFIQGFFSDRPSGEALLDRMAIKIHMPNQQMTPDDTIAMYDLVKNPERVHIVLPIADLDSLVQKVKIPDDMMTEIVSLARDIDQLITKKADDSRQQVRFGERESEYFPANQFSNRSVRRMVQVFKASLIAKQLMAGVPFSQMRTVPLRSDFALLARSALYLGPSKIEFKTYSLTVLKEDGEIASAGVKGYSDMRSEGIFHAKYSPYENQIHVVDLSGQTQFILEKKGSQWVTVWQSPYMHGWTIDTSHFNEIEARIQEVTAENKIDLNKPQFEVDDAIDRLLAKGTFKERTKQELLSIKEDLEQFTEVLNRHFESEPVKAVPRAAAKLLPARSEREIRTFRRDLLNASVRERAEKYYGWMTYEIHALKQRFVELDYSIEAHLTGLLSENHLYVFGPPGGAKTALAEVILKAELKKLNADQVDQFTREVIASIGHDGSFMRAALLRMRTDQPKQFDRFLLQFHKLLPEGVLVGFPKIETQLNEGREEIEVSSSLASQKFIFAILDEVDKANPQTITALLSILNEREVFAGSQVIKTALRTAVLTSNKMPSEFLDSYNEDRSTGEAVMDRAPNKVFVSNKISSNDALVDFLSNLEKGISPSWKGLLAVGELQPIVNEVDFERPEIKTMLAQIHQKFLALRIAEEERTRKEHLMDSREFPDYYVSAAGSASDRTFIKFMDQLKARFIIHQLMDGVEFKDLRTKIEFKDLILFFEGLGYWGPQKITAEYDKEGFLVINRDSSIIERLLSSGVVDSRVKFHLQMMSDEAKDYVEVLNSVVGDYMSHYKEAIRAHPELYPSLFSTHAAEEGNSPKQGP